MALDTAYYLVTMAIARRSGLVGKRYITTDGRFILDNKDLSRVRFTTEEYTEGLKGVERISEMQAQSLIAEGGYRTQPANVADTLEEEPTEAVIPEEADNSGEQEEVVEEEEVEAPAEEEAEPENEE